MQSVFDRDLLLVGHTPLHKNLLTSSRLGVWPVGNLRDRDNLSTTDKSPAPSVSAVQRFHCIYTGSALIYVTGRIQGIILWLGKYHDVALW